VQSFLGMLDGLMAYFALFVAQKELKGMDLIDMDLSAINARHVSERLTIKLAQYFITLG
jgi:hypothetical protein